MKQSEKVIFTRLMLSIAELYQKKISVQQIEIYWRSFHNFSLDVIREALDKHVLNPDNGQFMPKPADIIRFLQGTSEQQALHAWDKVTSAISDIGSYMSIIFDDPLIHLVVGEMGGWIKLCESSEKVLLFRGQEFQKRYRCYIGQKSLPYPRQLTGIIEQVNQSSSHNFYSTILYGNIEKAMQVFYQGISPQKFYQHQIMPFPHPISITHLLKRSAQIEIEEFSKLSDLSNSSKPSNGEKLCD